MAERSSELNNRNAIESNEGENLLEIPSGNQTLSETEEFNADAALAETAETDDARQIREQIEETRSQMSETIDAIQEKLSVSNITEQVKEQVVEQIGGAVETAKDVFYGKTNDLAKSVGRGLAQVGNSNLVKKTQENPWLLSAIGMGIGAILVGVLLDDQKPKRKKTRRLKNFDVPQTRQSYASNAHDEILFRTAENRDENFERADEQTSESALSNVGNAAGTVYQGVNRAAGKTFRAVSKASVYGYQKAGDLGSEIAENYQYYKEENPLIVGAAALAVGAAVGYAIPLTKTENEYFGEVRDKIVGQVQNSVQETVGSVKQTFEDARQIIAEEVKSQTAAR